MRDEGGLKTEDRRQRTEGRGRKTGKRKEERESDVNFECLMFNDEF